MTLEDGELVHIVVPLNPPTDGPSWPMASWRPRPPLPLGAAQRLTLLIEMLDSPAEFMGMCARWRRQWFSVAKRTARQPSGQYARDRQARGDERIREVTFRPVCRPVPISDRTRSSRFSVVEVEKSTESLATSDRANAVCVWGNAINQGIPEPLMVSFAVIVETIREECGLPIAVNAIAPYGQSERDQAHGAR
jgi:hypothetical protein